MANYVTPKFRMDFTFTTDIERQPVVKHYNCNVVNVGDYRQYSKTITYKAGGTYYREMLYVQHGVYGEWGNWPKVVIIYFFQKGDTIGDIGTEILTQGWTCDIDINKNLDLDTLGITAGFPDESTTFTVKKTSRVFWTEKPAESDELVWGYDSTSGTYMWLYPDDVPEIIAVGGGRYGQQLVVVGHNCIYYGSL
jgi:hypothetical protein